VAIAVAFKMKIKGHVLRKATNH